MFKPTMIAIASSFAISSANAQLVSVPVEIPMPFQVDPVNFGTSHAVGDGSIFIGGMGELVTEPLTPCGVYEFDSETLAYVNTFQGDQENIEDDFFGFAVEYENGLLWVGAPLTDDGDDENGSAYVFDPSNTTQLNTFTADDVFDSFGIFGWDLSITSSAVMIGAPGFIGGGKVFIYNPITYSFFATLGRDPTTDDFNYGWKVEHSDQYVVVSAKGDQAISPDGAVYVYDFASGFLVYRLTSPIVDTDGGDEFGNEIALEGDTLLVGFGSGAPASVRGNVAAYDLTTGTLVTLLDGDTATNQDLFGVSISIEGTTAIIGASATNDPRLPGETGEDRGALYIYDLTTMTQTEKIMLPTSIENRKGFGSVVTIQDGTIVASSSTDVIGINRAYVIKEFCRPDLNLDGSIDFFDVSMFLNDQFDWDMNGSFDFFDISAFLASYQAGCP